MADQTHKQLRRATIVFWVLFLYIIAALVWWLVSLEQLSKFNPLFIQLRNIGYFTNNGVASRFNMHHINSWPLPKEIEVQIILSGLCYRNFNLFPQKIKN